MEGLSQCAATRGVRRCGLHHALLGTKPRGHSIVVHTLPPSTTAPFLTTRRSWLQSRKTKRGSFGILTLSKFDCCCSELSYPPTVLPPPGHHPTGFAAFSFEMIFTSLTAETLKIVRKKPGLNTSVYDRKEKWHASIFLFLLLFPYLPKMQAFSLEMIFTSLTAETLKIVRKKPGLNTSVYDRKEMSSCPITPACLSNDSLYIIIFSITFCEVKNYIYIYIYSTHTAHFFLDF